MRTCGRCGVNCTGRHGPREPTELEKAMFWFCGWREMYRKKSVKNWHRWIAEWHSSQASVRLETAIRANAGK